VQYYGIFCEIAVYSCNPSTGVCEASFSLLTLNFWSHSELCNATFDFISLACSVLHYRKKIEFLCHVQSTGRINFSRFTTEFWVEGREGSDGYVWVADRISYEHLPPFLYPFHRLMQIKFWRYHAFNIWLQGRLQSICSVRSRETTLSNLGRVRNIILPVISSFPKFLQPSTGIQPRDFLPEEWGCRFPVGPRHSAPTNFLSVLFSRWKSGRRCEANHSSLSSAEVNAWRYPFSHTPSRHYIILSIETILPLFYLLPTYCLLNVTVTFEFM
jgi:hypothetical protein